MNDGPTDAEAACFEVGVKFGSLYHQFAGTPVSPESATSLECAIEESIENQPYCESVTVDVLTDRLSESIEHEHGYAELTGAFVEAEVVVAYEGVRVTARMAMENGYPRMRITSIER